MMGIGEPGTVPKMFTPPPSARLPGGHIAVNPSSGEADGPTPDLLIS
ncbi:MAG: hypothetical protein AABZ80_05890 [Gemmatimonadota bacterium]